MVACKSDVRFDPEPYTLCPVPGLRHVKDCRFSGVYLWCIECAGEWIAYAGQFLTYYVGQGMGQGGIGDRVWCEVKDWDKKLREGPDRHRNYFTSLDWLKFAAGIRVDLNLTGEEFNRHILRQNEVIQPRYRVLVAPIDDQTTANMVEDEIVHRLRLVGGRTFDFCRNRQKWGNRHGHHPEIGEITAGGRKIIGLTGDVPAALRLSIIA